MLGPVFAKELLEASRKPQYYFMRVSLGVIVLLLLLAMMASRSGEFDSVAAQNRFAQQVFSGWLIAQCLVLPALAPPMVGGLIAGEREAGSLDLLFTTQLTGREIVAGKLASRLLILLLIQLSSLPVVVLLGLFGGVNVPDLILGTTVTTAMTVAVGGACLWFSASVRRPWVAALLTYGLFAFLWLGLLYAVVFATLFLQQVFGGGRMMVEPDWFKYLLLESPPFCLALTVERVGNRVPWWIPYSSSAIWTLFGLMMAWLAGWRMRRPLSTAAPWPTRLFRFMVSLPGRALRRLPGRGVRARVVDAPAGPLLDRFPVVWRNRRARVFDPDHQLFNLQLLGGATLLGLYMLVALAHPTGDEDGQRYMMLAALFAWQTLLAVVAAGSVSRERERGSLDLLSLSDLPARQMAIGALHGTLVATMPMALVCGLMALLWQVQRFSASPFPFFDFLLGLALPTTVPVVIPVVVAAAWSLLIAVGGVLISICAPRVAPAVVASLAAMGFHWFFFGIAHDPGSEVIDMVASLLLAGVAYGLWERRPSLLSVVLMIAILVLATPHEGRLRLTLTMIVAAGAGLLMLRSERTRFVGALMSASCLPGALGLTALMAWTMNVYQPFPAHGELDCLEVHWCLGEVAMRGITSDQLVRLALLLGSALVGGITTLYLAAGWEGLLFPNRSPRVAAAATIS